MSFGEFFKIIWVIALFYGLVSVRGFAATNHQDTEWDELTERQQTDLLIEQFKRGPVGFDLLLANADPLEKRLDAEQNEEARAWLHLLLGAVGEARYDFKEAFFHYQSGVRLGDRLPSEKQKNGIRIKGWSYLGLAYLDRGILDSAAYWTEQAFLVADTGEGVDSLSLASAIKNRAIVFKLRGELNRAEEFYNRAMKIEEGLGLTKKVGDSRMNLGLIAVDKALFQGDPNGFEQSDFHYHEALAIYQSLPGEWNKGLIAQTYQNLGVSLAERGEPQAAVERFYEAIVLLEQLEGYEDELGLCLNSLGISHNVIGDYERAEEAYKRAIDIFDTLGFDNRIAQVKNNLGLNYLRKGQHAQAFPQFQQALAINRKLRDPENVELEKAIANNLDNLAETRHELGQYAQAEPLYLEALKIREGLNLQQGISMTCTQLAEVYALKGDYPKAFEYLDRGYRLARESGVRQLVMLNHQKRWVIHKYQKNYREAISAYEAYTSLKDSLQNERILANVDELNVKYDNERLVRDLERFKPLEGELQLMTEANRAQRYALWALGIIGGLVLLLGIIIFRNNLQKTKTNKVLIAQNEEIKRQNEQINQLIERQTKLAVELRHRAINNMTLLQTLLKAHSRKLDDPDAQAALRDSEGRVRSMALIQRQLFNAEFKGVESLNNEARDMADGVDMEDYLSTLIGHLLESFDQSSIQTELRVTPDLIFDSEMSTSIGLIVNELVTNSLKHAFSGLHGEGAEENTLMVHLLVREHGGWLLLVADNGVGLPGVRQVNGAGLGTARNGAVSKVIEDLGRESYGMHLVGQLIKQLNADLTVVAEGGTRFEMVIPEENSSFPGSPDPKN